MLNKTKYLSASLLCM